VTRACTSLLVKSITAMAIVAHTFLAIGSVVLYCSVVQNEQQEVMMKDCYE
jgi:hypothetical protein